MSALVIIFSIAGAILFWAAGYFLSGARASPTTTNFERDAARSRVRELELELEALRQEQPTTVGPDAQTRIAALEHQLQNPPGLAEARSRIASLEAELKGSGTNPDSTRRIEVLEREVQTARAATGEVDRLKAELTRALAQVDRLEAAKSDEKTQVVVALPAPAAATTLIEPLGDGERRALEVKADDLAKQVKALESELRLVQREEAGVSEREAAATKELSRLQGDNSRLEADLKRAEARVLELQRAAEGNVDRVVQLDAELKEERARAKTDLAMKQTAHQNELKLSEERANAIRAELVAAREEVAALKTQSDDVSRLASELGAIEAENQRLKAMEFASHAKVLKPVLDLPPEPTGDHLKDVLQATVDRAMTSGASSAAVSDGVGLVIAGAGEHSESLAALAALFVELSGRATRILPLQGLSRAQLEDANGVSVSVQGFSGGSMVLATLGVRHAVVSGPAGNVAPAAPVRPS